MVAYLCRSASTSSGAESGALAAPSSGRRCAGASASRGGGGATLNGFTSMPSAEGNDHLCQLDCCLPSMSLERLC